MGLVLPLFCCSEIPAPLVIKKKEITKRCRKGLRGKGKIYSKFD